MEAVRESSCCDTGHCLMMCDGRGSPCRPGNWHSVNFWTGEGFTEGVVGFILREQMPMDTEKSQMDSAEDLAIARAS